LDYARLIGPGFEGKWPEISQNQPESAKISRVKTSIAYINPAEFSLC
jgi:hypothetical protein